MPARAKVVPAPAGNAPSTARKAAEAAHAKLVHKYDTYDADAQALVDRKTGAQRPAGVTVPQCEVDRMCCGVGNDGGFSRPGFLSDSSPYQSGTSAEKFFARRGGGGLKAGNTRKLFAPRAGAVHGAGGDTGKVQVGATQTRSGRMRCGKAPAQFSKPGFNGPSESPTSRAPRGAGGALRVGKGRDPWVPEYVLEGSRPEKKASKSVGKPLAGAFKSAGNGKGDFFDPSAYWSDAGEDGSPVKKEWTVGGPWKATGPKHKDAFNKPPPASNDVYGEKPPPGAETRSRGRIRMGAMHGRALQPVPWEKVRTFDNYRTRNLEAKGGLGTTATNFIASATNTFHMTQ